MRHTIKLPLPLKRGVFLCPGGAGPQYIFSLRPGSPGTTQAIQSQEYLESQFSDLLDIAPILVYPIGSRNLQGSLSRRASGEGKKPNGHNY